jgi:hypothetical protein
VHVWQSVNNYDADVSSFLIECDGMHCHGHYDRKFPTSLFCFYLFVFIFLFYLS